jgi:hypothetical protein
MMDLQLARLLRTSFFLIALLFAEQSALAIDDQEEPLNPLSQRTICFACKPPKPFPTNTGNNGSSNGRPLAVKPSESHPRLDGDLLGRDLNYPIVSVFGHVGIWDSSSRKVIEVMNEPRVIQENSLHRFVTKSPYWGARGYDSRWGFREVVTFAKREISFGPAAYTVRAFYTAGSSRGPGTFRCDTFVIHLYDRAGINIDGLRLPVAVWNRFKVKR